MLCRADTCVIEDAYDIVEKSVDDGGSIAVSACPSLGTVILYPSRELEVMIIIGHCAMNVYYHITSRAPASAADNCSP